MFEVFFEFDSSYLEIAHSQMLPGYLIQFSKIKYNQLNDMPFEERRIYLNEMSMVGDAILKVTNADRINYEILGNHHNVVHTHIFPRYSWEEEKYRIGPVYYYDRDEWDKNQYKYSSERHQELFKAIQDELKRIY